MEKESVGVAPVQTKDVGVGTLIWYHGRTSLGQWNCPAVICRVRGSAFYVMSLDDMREQSQDYWTEITEHTPDSRRNMRLASVAEVDAYLVQRGSEKTAAQIIAQVQEVARQELEQRAMT